MNSSFCFLSFKMFISLPLIYFSCIIYAAKERDTHFIHFYCEGEITLELSINFYQERCGY